MEKMKLPADWLKKMDFLSDEFCELHVKPVQKMKFKGEVVCPRCEVMKNDERQEEYWKERYEQIKRDRKYNILFHQSIIEDETLLNARLENYIVREPEETQNKKTVLEALERLNLGDIFNLVLQGKPGSGKSHLAYSVLHRLNEPKTHSCLFISIEGMIRKIKESFHNKESQYTEEYFIELLSDVDFLCLDDLGAETGAINTDKQATNFVQRVLYGVATVRQNKATILTTNLSSKTLYNMYDEKLVSRLLRRPKFVIFKETKDKRANLPF